jgi:eukaryotic-like serine/threonine-protein kinase
MAMPALLLDDRYRLDERIAVGGMGEVWRATDLLLQRPVAVKLIRSEYTQEEGLARFRAEARYAGSLSHPNIAQIYDYGTDDATGQPYLVMELVNGPALATMLADGPLEPGRAMDIIAQAAAGLAAAHAAGLVHRDIKPGNLLVSSEGLVKIADFGIVYADSAAPVTRTGEVVGTPAYLAPEQVAGHAATPAADLYSLGIVAHQCLTGHPPFDGEPLAVAIAQQEKPLPPLPASVPAEVTALISQLAAKDPRDRPASAADVARQAGRLATALGRSTIPGFPTVGSAAAAVAAPTLLAGAASAGRDRTAAGGAGAADAAPGGSRGARRRLPGFLAIPATLPGRAGIVLGALALLGVAGWLAGNTGSPVTARHHRPPPAAHKAPPASSGSIASGGSPGPSTIATPQPSTPLPSHSPSASPKPSASATPTPTAPATSAAPSPTATTPSPTPSTSTSPTTAAPTVTPGTI